MIKRRPRITAMHVVWRITSAVWNKGAWGCGIIQCGWGGVSHSHHSLYMYALELCSTSFLVHTASPGRLQVRCPRFKIERSWQVMWYILSNGERYLRGISQFPGRIWKELVIITEKVKKKVRQFSTLGKPIYNNGKMNIVCYLAYHITVFI